MLEKRWCPERNRILVCVDDYCDGNPSGRFYHCSQEGEEFESLSRLLIKIQLLLDEQQKPQSYTILRSFSANLDPLSTEGLPVSAPRGAKGTFELQILFRQHTSWQGVILWKEGKREHSFRSVLELIHLMDSALREMEEAA